jgi:hypothetical protein
VQVISPKALIICPKGTSSFVICNLEFVISPKGARFINSDGKVKLNDNRVNNFVAIPYHLGHQKREDEKKMKAGKFARNRVQTFRKDF